jgi:ferrous iron transport protein A
MPHHRHRPMHCPEGESGGLPAMPLTMASAGQELILAEIRGGRRFLHRLAELGLGPGAKFRVLSKGNPGPFLIAVRETRLVIGRGMVEHVFVYPA